MLEKDIIAGIKAYLKTVPNCFYWKNHGGRFGQGGLPDVCCCIAGRFAAFEVKTDKGRVTVLQQVTLRRIRAAGGIAEVVRSVDEVKEIVQRLG